MTSYICIWSNWGHSWVAGGFWILWPQSYFMYVVRSAVHAVCSCHCSSSPPLLLYLKSKTSPEVVQLVGLGCLEHNAPHKSPVRISSREHFFSLSHGPIRLQSCSPEVVQPVGLGCLEHNVSHSHRFEYCLADISSLSLSCDHDQTSDLLPEGRRWIPSAIE